MGGPKVAGPASSPAPQAPTWRRSPTPTRWPGMCPTGAVGAAPTWRVRRWRAWRPGRCLTCRRLACGSPGTGPSGAAAPVGDDPGRLPRARARCGLLRGAGAGVLPVRAPHLPVDRAAQLLADVLGAPLASGTLAAVLTEGAAGLDGFTQVVREGLAAAPVAHFDETGARVAGAAALGPLGLHRPAHAAHRARQAGQGGDGCGRGAVRVCGGGGP
jgi:hypothetical protein